MVRLDRAFAASLCIMVLGIVMAAAGSLHGTAADSRFENETIVVPLPESDAGWQIEADGFCRFDEVDVQQIGQTGEPSIPYRSVTVLLPPNASATTVRTRVTGCQWTALDGEWNVPPIPPPATCDGEETFEVLPADRNIVDVKDAGIYGSDSFFPAEPIRKVDVHVMRGWVMAQVFYAPYAYNPVRRQLGRLSGGAIEVTFGVDPQEDNAADADPNCAGQIREMTANFAETAPEYPGYAPSAATERYVIITTGATENASAQLADFVGSKESRGFAVEVVTEETWGGGTGDIAAERIRSWLKDNYIAMNIRYVLLIGNPDPSAGDVPMKMCYPRSPTSEYPSDLECPTDFYYAELTSDWDADHDGQYGEYVDDFRGSPPRSAEVSVGRIPHYGSIDDLDHILSKIVVYESAPAGTTSWRRNVLLPMNPLDSSTPGYHLGEAIKNDLLIPDGWTYHRAYDEVYGLTPAPETMPCNVSNVTSAWNGSDFGGIFWTAHGGTTSAEDVMDLSHAATLDDEHPGFTFQCSCSNGNPEASNNLGYSLLKNGCVATVSASRVSWYSQGQTSFSGSASAPGMTYEYARRLITEEMCAGDALNDLKLDVAPGSQEQWMNYLDFNLYGCPAVGPFTDLIPPSVITDNATDLTTDGATLNGDLTDLGTAISVNVSFEWGTSPGSYSHETEPEGRSVTGSFDYDLGNLNPGTTYYFRAKAAGHDTSYGAEKSFTTLIPASVTTGNATYVTTDGATLNGSLTDLGTATSVSVSFEWGTSPGSYSREIPARVMSTAGSFHYHLSGLSPGTAYYFRAKAVGHDTSYGAEKSFTTLIPASVTTGNATGVTTSTAVLNGSLTDLGTATSVSVSFEWGTSPGFYSHETTAEGRSATGSFDYDLGNLNPGTIYYFRAKAAGHDTSYGAEKSFTTLIPASVTTGDATGVAKDGATLNGSLTGLGTATSVSVSFEWGTSPGSYSDETTAEGRSVTGSFDYDLGNLNPDTTYYFRAKAVGDDTSYGAEKSFTTGTTPPAAATDDAGSVTTTAAQLIGTVTDLGTAPGVTVSFEWGTSPGSYSDETTAEGRSVTGSFDYDLGNLNPGTTYYFRAKAVGHGTGYGAEKSFTTGTTPPAAATDDAGSITATTAQLIGTVTDLGTAPGVTVSFEWGTSPGSYSHETTAEDRSVTGSFDYDLGNLNPGTTYYFRAKVIGHGTGYGAEKSFNTLDNLAPALSQVSSSDITVSSAAITWTTNEPATSRVEYGLTPECGAATAVDLGLATSHRVDLVGLSPNRVYFYRVISRDASENQAQSEVRTFRTTSTSAPSSRMPIWAWPVIGAGGLLILASLGYFISRRPAK